MTSGVVLSVAVMEAIFSMASLYPSFDSLSSFISRMAFSRSILLRNHVSADAHRM